MPARPDRAEVAVELRYLADGPESALGEVAARSIELETLLDELGVEREDWSTSGVSVREHSEWEADRLVHKGYLATNRTLVRVTTAELVARLLTGAVSRAEASVRGPQWVVDDDNVARIDAYRRAAEDARRRAGAYAEALGLELGDVESLEEPAGYQEYPMARAATGSPLEVEDLAVNPGTLTISAVIDATFLLRRRE